jgi:hypothetical protein
VQLKFKPIKMKKTNRETTPSLFTKGKQFISNMQTFHQLFFIYFVLFLYSDAGGVRVGDVCWMQYD